MILWYFGLDGFGYSLDQHPRRLSGYLEDYRLIDLRARSFLLRDYQTTWGWAKVFLKALVE